MKRRTKKKKPTRFQKQIRSSMKTPVTQIPKMNTQRTIIPANATNSLLDKMEDGHEYESLLKHKAVNIDLAAEIRKSIAEIQTVRHHPTICYLANYLNSNIKASTAIDYGDDLPFSEMIATIPAEVKEIDIILVTPGGSAQQVAKFVDRLRPRFERVTFIIPNIAMSAGTIFVMSGDEIIMDKKAYIGPIDPQIPNKDGLYIPAQAILTAIEEIQKRGDDLLSKGQNPLWTDLQILRQIDAKEIGNAINASRYSMELVTNYLLNFKFRTWTKHSNNTDVTPEEKKKRAEEIASVFCDHALWKTHSRGITKEIAWEICKLKITALETFPDLERSIRRFWALIYWIFEHTPLYKTMISDNYCIFRHDISLMKIK